MNEQKKWNKSTSNYLKYSGLAFEMLAIILLFTYGGIKLDQWIAPSFPVFTLALSILGVSLGVYVGLKDFIKKNNKK